MLELLEVITMKKSAKNNLLKTPGKGYSGDKDVVIGPHQRQFLVKIIISNIFETFLNS